MKLLSEAIREGRTLRPEGRERFDYIANHDELRSDPWGAACEAVQPAVAHFNWQSKDKHKLDSAMAALNAIQHHYFDRYWQMPARCPGATQPYLEAGGRIINRKGEVAVTEGKTGDLGGVTSECDKVEQMAGMVDHLFYAHRWSTEQVIEAVQWYEQTRSMAILGQAFQHYRNPASATATNYKLTQQALQFLRARKQKRGY